MAILIIGLGNPGREYENTRHNVGFLAVDKIAESLKANWKVNKTAHAEIIETNYHEQKIVLAKPQTFMNLSGTSVTYLANKFKITPANIWVISDDVALPLGTLRVRVGGSAGGHNGLKSIIETLGTDSFVRFRIGINEPQADVPLEAYVLQKFSKDEQKILVPVIDKAHETILKSITAGVSETSIK